MAYTFLSLVIVQGFIEKDRLRYHANNRIGLYNDNIPLLFPVLGMQYHRSVIKRLHTVHLHLKLLTHDSTGHLAPESLFLKHLSLQVVVSLRIVQVGVTFCSTGTSLSLEWLTATASLSPVAFCSSSE